VLKFILIILLNIILVIPAEAKLARDPFAINCTVLSCDMLTQYKLSQLHFVGTIIQINSPKKWALISAPDSRLYSVTLNMPIGAEGGRVVDINSNRMTIETQSTEMIYLTLIKRDSHENTESHLVVPHDNPRS
jgi:hypothetical protein